MHRPLLFLSTLLFGGFLSSTFAQVIRINAGGDDYRDSGGRLWKKDKYFYKGASYKTTKSIQNTMSDTLYKSERWRSRTAGSGNLIYKVPVDRDGQYEVTLHFAEIYSKSQSIGRRIFHIVIDRVMALPNVDIYRMAGGGYRAMKRSFRTDSSGGTIRIELVSVKSNPKISAIEIRRVSNSKPTVHKDIKAVVDVVGGVEPLGIYWADSYSVGDRCYCVSTFDHDIGTVMVNTQVGWMTVKEACDLLGKGPGYEGHPIYNDIQCGNGPANNAGDEHVCPGRVDIGVEGCGHIGPTWKFR